MSKIEIIATISSALILLLILINSIVFPNFKTAYEHGFGSNDPTDLNNEYCISRGNVVACSGCNVTSGSGYNTFLDTCHSLISRQNGTHCYQCNNFGFRSVSRGMFIFLLVGFLIICAIMIKITLDSVKSQKYFLRT